MSVDNEQRLHLPELERAEIRFQIGTATVAHEKHPERNEDAFFANAGKGVFGVFDGMGGQAGGDIASSIAKQEISSPPIVQLDHPSLRQLAQVFTEEFARVRQLIIERGQQEKKPNMTTTATVLKFINGIGLVFIGHTGDSRVYVYHGDKKQLVQITCDHDLIRNDYRGDPRKMKELQEKLSKTNPLQLSQMPASDEKRTL